MNAVAKHEPQSQELAPVQDISGGILAVIERAARDPSVDVEKMERLFAMSERVQQRQAEAAFNAAMNDAQSDMRPISADAHNPQTKSKYASYAQLDKALRPIYTKHGFSLSFGEADSPKPEHVRVVCWVSHVGGHTREYHRDMPADGKGAKGGDVMTKTHAAGAAGSYGARYLLKGIFNVAVGEDDRDGNEAGEVINDRQLGHIRDLIADTGSDIARFCRFFGIEALPDLPAKRYEEAVRQLNAKAGKKPAGGAQ